MSVYLLKPSFFEENSSTTTSNVTDTMPARERVLQVFTGDVAVLLKGELLDQQYKELYEKLPDTLIHLQFDDWLYCIECSSAVVPADIKYSYSYFPENTTEEEVSNATIAMNPRFGALVQYLELAEGGKATFPVFSQPANVHGGEMVTKKEFNERYKNYFSGLWQRVPYEVREELLKFLHSKDGEYFDFAKVDQEFYPCVLHGSFTGKDKDEVVCVLSNAEHITEGDSSQMIMVYAFNQKGQYHLAYQEEFHIPVQIEGVYHHPEENAPDVYRGAEEKQALSFDGIRIKRKGESDVVLVYNEGLDYMERYVQLPLSELNKLYAEGDEGTEEDK